jgi:hypothetical protein
MGIEQGRTGVSGRAHRTASSDLEPEVFFAIFANNLAAFAVKP